jgi:tetratricopeptide (TPR) repeat protein
MHILFTRAAVAAFLLVGLNLAGCTTGRSPDTPDPQLALKLNDQASEAYPENPREAMRLLEASVQADPYCGPCYNNLGVMYLHLGDRERAADALDQAQRNMPQDPRPYVNLALVFAEAHQFAESMSFVEDALELRPNYMPALQLKTWLQIRTEEPDETTLPALERIAVRSKDPEWRRFGEEYALKLRGELEARERGDLGN